MSESTADLWPPTAEHPSVETIADYVEDLLPPEQTAALAAHLAGCDECAETEAALTEIQSLLGEAEAPAMPDDVAARITAALDAEAQSREDSARPQAVFLEQSQVVEPSQEAPPKQSSDPTLEPARPIEARNTLSAPPAAPPGPSGPGRNGTGDRPPRSPGDRRPRRVSGRLLRRAGLGLAVLAAVGGITTALVHGGGGSGGASSGAEAGAAQSSPVFTRSGLPQQIQALVAEEPGATPSGSAPSGTAIGPQAQHPGVTGTGPAPSSAAGSSAAGSSAAAPGATTSGATAVPACVLQAVHRADAQPVAESPGTYQGVPVYALVYDDPANPQGSLDAYLVDATCALPSSGPNAVGTAVPVAPGKVLLEQTVPRR